MGNDNDISILKQMKHVICWDQNILPDFIIPSSKYYKKFLNYGSILPEVVNLERWDDMPSEIALKMKAKKGLIFISFGSYGKSELLNIVLPLLFGVIKQYCQRNNYFVIYQNGEKITEDTPENKEWIFYHTGFIPYEYIVPKSKLVVFTGSVCLQTLCFYHQTPMLFVPLLAEQFFWSKNYRYFTDVKYIDYTKGEKNKLNISDLKCAIGIKNRKVKSYLSKVSSSLKKRQSRSKLLF